MTTIDYSNSPRSIDLKAICLNPDFGVLKFEKCLPQLEKIQTEIIELEDLDYAEYLTQQETNQIETAKNTFNNYVEQISTFSVSQPNPQETRDNIENQVDSYYQNSFASQTRNALIYLRQLIKLDSKTEKDLTQAVANAKKIEKELSERLDNIKKDESSVAKGSGIVSSKYLSAEFEDQFRIHEIEAESKWFKWLGYSYPGLIIWIIVAFIVLLVIRFNYPDDKALFIEWGVFSALMISILFFGVRFIVNNYNIQKNLSAVNRHRRNVAQTLINFIESEKSTDDMRSVILKDAARALFEHQSTGYLSKEQMQVSTPVQEMITKIITDKV